MFPTETSEFVCRSTIHAGGGALAHIPHELSRLGSRKPFILSTAESSSKGCVRQVVRAFKNSGLTMAIFDKITSPCDAGTVRQLKALFHAGGCDAVVAVGGGRIMDLAKVLNVAVSNRDADLGSFQGYEGPIPGLKPLFFVPVSPGNGYETTGRTLMPGVMFSSRDAIPDCVIIDPALLLREQPLGIISSAMTALTHAAEAFIAPSRTPWVEAFAVTAIHYLFHHLPFAINKQHWRGAQFALLNGEVLAGFAFHNSGEGASHIMGSAISNYTALAPGICMGILLPYVLDYHSAQAESTAPELLLPMVGPERFANIPSHLRASNAAKLLLELQFSLFLETGKQLPLSLEDAGLDRARLIDIGQGAFPHTFTEINTDGRMMILEHAWRGEAISTA